MNMNVNNCTLIGNLCADVELKFTSAGSGFANLRIATNENWTDSKTGEKKTRTEFHRVTVWNSKVAENCARYLSKGRLVHIVGKLSTRKYTDNAGVVRFVTEVLAQQVNFLGTRPKDAAGEPVAPQDAPVDDVDSTDIPL